MSDDIAVTSDPWEPDDPDVLPEPGALLAYWRTANQSESAQRRLVADPWLLWRLARDLADALEGCPSAGEQRARYEPGRGTP